MNKTMISNKIDSYAHSSAIGFKSHFSTIGLKSYLRTTGHKLLVVLMLTLYLMMPVFTHFIIHKFSLTAL